MHVNDELSRTLKTNLTICSANTRGNEFVKILTGISRVKEASSSAPEMGSLEKDAAKSATSRPIFFNTISYGVFFFVTAEFFLGKKCSFATNYG